MINDNTLSGWCALHESEQAELLRTLCAIPAPSHHEEKRAALSGNGWRKMAHAALMRTK